MHEFSEVLERLRLFYREPDAPPASGPFELILWENACYLLPIERRLEVFKLIRSQVGLSANAILLAPESILLSIAIRGGIRPEIRVFRWRQIAQITRDRFNGNLDSILALPYADAKRALRQFPGISDPVAQKILLLCGMPDRFPLELNGMRALLRLGWGRPQSSFGATVNSIRGALAGQLPRSSSELKDAYLLLHQHGHTLCTDKAPACDRCPLADRCQFASSAAPLEFAAD